MKYLIIRFSSLGDVILTTAVMNYLKMVDPECEISLLTDKNYTELFLDDTRLKSVIGLKKHESHWNISLFNESWDHIIDLQNGKRSHSILEHFKNAKKITHLHKLHLPRTFLLLARKDLYPFGSDIITRYLNTAEIHSIVPHFNRAPSLTYRAANPSYYERMLQTDSINRPFIAFFPFSAWKNKEWSIKNFSVVGKFFQILGWNILILGSTSEYEKAEELRAMIGHHVLVLAGKISLYECGCVLKHCSLALGNDSGLSHLARACGVKTGIIFGPTTQHLGFYPSGLPEYRVFETQQFCRPCHPHGGNRCFQMRHACMTRISPETVISGLITLLRGHQK